MSTKLTPFAFGDQLVRTMIDEHGNPWFVVKDVCQVLEIQNPSDTVRKLLDEDEKGIATIYTLGGEQELLIISESSLYSLIFCSRKPEAKIFSKWVRGEVLPSLRKTGTYTMPSPVQEPVKALEPELEPLPSRAAPVPDIQLPESALLLRPSMRMRLWQDALQSARLEGAGMQYAVECFVKLCTVMAMTPKIKESPARTEIKAFIQAQCRHSPGVNTRSHILYEAFRVWRKGQSKCLGKGLGKGYMPSHKVFGETMGLYYAKLFSNGSWYRDVSLASCSAPA